MAATAEHPSLLSLEVVVNTGQEQPAAGGLQRRAWMEELEHHERAHAHQERGEWTDEDPLRARTELGPDAVFVAPSSKDNFVRRGKE